jgi:serine/threonine protein kinase
MLDEASTKPITIGVSSDAPTIPIDETSASRSSDPVSAASIGHYRIIRLLGEGGMGAVYEAEQDQPRRRVALKIIRAAWASPELLCRFELESEALGNPLPVQLEPGSMPASDRIRLHQDQRLSPLGQEAAHSMIQRNRSQVENPGCGRRRAKTASCCRNARFSRRRSRRARNERTSTPNMTLRRRSMTALYHRKLNGVVPDGVLARHKEPCLFGKAA